MLWNYGMVPDHYLSTTQLHLHSANILSFLFTEKGISWSLYKGKIWTLTSTYTCGGSKSIFNICMIIITVAKTGVGAERQPEMTKRPLAISGLLQLLRTEGSRDAWAQLRLGIESPVNETVWLACLIGVISPRPSVFSLQRQVKGHLMSLEVLTTVNSSCELVFAQLCYEPREDRVNFDVLSLLIQVGWKADLHLL